MFLWKVSAFPVSLQAIFPVVEEPESSESVFVSVKWLVARFSISALYQSISCTDFLWLGQRSLQLDTCFLHPRRLMCIACSPLKLDPRKTEPRYRPANVYVFTFAFVSFVEFWLPSPWRIGWASACSTSQLHRDTDGRGTCAENLQAVWCAHHYLSSYTSKKSETTNDT